MYVANKARNKKAINFANIVICILFKGFFTYKTKSLNFFNTQIEKNNFDVYNDQLSFSIFIDALTFI
tara:strand:+ start:1370 stop:1570 length:201 start_codon:yes stop_codon:yes gene_type:complete